MQTRFTLLELNNLIREVLQDNLTESYWVVAEISEMKVNRTGHCYLELVEKGISTDDIIARARATIWSYTFRMIRPYFETSTGQPFTDGIKVLLRVSVEFHPAYGLSLNVRDIDPTYTLGDLVRRRREIILKLQDAGVYDMNRDIPLPLVPQRIAVISSATAAGYQDFINQLVNNTYGFAFQHRLFEAFMQGSEAVPSILNALDAIYRVEDEFDAVVVIRGGGAQADLSCFDNFDLAFAVAQFPLPVITGIGHEKDDTILDLVAHTRQKTPTAVAEFFISGLARFQDRLDEWQRNIVEMTREILADKTEEVNDLADRLKQLTNQALTCFTAGLKKLAHRCSSGVNQYVKKHTLFLFRYHSRIARTPSLILQKKKHACSRLSQQARILFRSRLAAYLQTLKQTGKQMPVKVRVRLQAETRRLKSMEESIRHLDPRNILQRGFTLTLQKNSIVKSVHALTASDDLETRFHDGSVISKLIGPSNQSTNQ